MTRDERLLLRLVLGVCGYSVVEFSIMSNYVKSNSVLNWILARQISHYVNKTIKNGKILR